MAIATQSETRAYVIQTDEQGRESLLAVRNRGMELFTTQKNALIISDTWLTCTVIGARAMLHSREWRVEKFVYVFESVRIKKESYVNDFDEVKESWELLGTNDKGIMVSLGYVPEILVDVLNEGKSRLYNITVVKTGDVYTLSADYR